MQLVISKIQLRDATLDDAPFIARVVLAGIDMLDIDAVLPDEQRAIFEHLIEICCMDDTLYSYCNTRIAEVDNARKDFWTCAANFWHGFEPQCNGNLSR